MLPTFPQFKRLELTDQRDIRAITDKYPPYSDFNFISMWSWDVKGEMRISELNGNLVVRFNDYITGEPFYSFLGTNFPLDTTEKLIKHAKAQGLKPELRLVPEVCILETPKTVTAEEDRDNFDYIYSTHDLANCSGNKFLTKRNLINRFHNRQGTPVVKRINLGSPAGKKQIYDLMNLWKNNKDNHHKEADIENEYRAIGKLFHASKDLHLVSVGVFLGSALVGFTISELVNQEYVLAHFSKADTSYPGVYDVMMMENCKIFAGRLVERLNYEQDLGLPSLRHSKNSYRPVFFLKKFRVRISDLAS